MEDPEKSLPLAEGVVDAEQAAKEGRNKTCLNCNTPLTGKYCSTCGQRDLPARQDLGDLFINFISSFYSFESKFFKTFHYLLFRPGKIVAEYNAGKRESFYHPARMYVFLSFIFFLLLSIFAGTDKMNLDDSLDFNPRDSVKADSIIARVDSVVAAETGKRKKPVQNKLGYSVDQQDKGIPEGETLAEYDSIQNAIPESKRDGFVERFFRRKAFEVEAKGKDKEKEITKQFIDDAVGNIPRMLFFLMPIFALLLKLLYLRRDYFYSEHLVFTVLYYDFIYLMGSLIILVNQVEWLSWVQYVLYGWIGIYLYKSLRNVYKQRRTKTVVKFFMLITMFFFCVVAGIVVVFLVAFANL
jgi:hypothetical protein